MSHTTVFALMLCVTAVVATGGDPTRAEQNAPLTVAVNSPRPLADAVRVLERRHGVVITYEDPTYEDDSQTRDITDEIRKTPWKPSEPRTIVPRGGAFAFGYGIDNERPMVGQLTSIVASALSHYQGTGYAGAFRLDRTEDALHVIPTSARRASGANQPHEAVLTTEVQLHVGERTRHELVNEILQSVTAATGVNVHQGTVPINYLIGTKVTVPELLVGSARSLLVRVLGPGLSWQLFNSPWDARGPTFVLNIHSVDVKPTR